MRIYNGTNSQMDLPLTGIQRISIPAKSFSGDIMAGSEFLSLLVTSYTPEEIALVVSGPWELNLCSTIPVTASYAVQTMDEALSRFNPVTEEAPAAEPEVAVIEEEGEKVEEQAPVEDEPQPEVAVGEPEVIEEEVAPIVEKETFGGSKKNKKKRK